MLTLMAINIQAARALLYRTCALIDMTEAIRALPRRRTRPRPTRRARRSSTSCEHNTQLIRFFTPLCKYYATEISNHVTRQGIQVHGGIGYMAESPAGHYHSDSIITTIYEGTSEIQASFALKEMARARSSPRWRASRAELEALRAQRPELVQLVCDGIEWISDVVPRADGRPAVRAAQRQARLRDGDRRRGQRRAALPGGRLGGKPRAGRRASSTATCWPSR